MDEAGEFPIFPPCASQPTKSSMKVFSKTIEERDCKGCSVLFCSVLFAFNGKGHPSVPLLRCREGPRWCAGAEWACKLGFCGIPSAPAKNSARTDPRTERYQGALRTRKGTRKRYGKSSGQCRGGVQKRSQPWVFPHPGREGLGP